jgi:hypothetical protein
MVQVANLGRLSVFDHMGRMKELAIMNSDSEYDQYFESMHNQYLSELADGKSLQEDAMEHHSNGNAVVEQVAQPNLTMVSTKKHHHSDLVLNTVCVACAHCGLALTDAVSVERGMGGRCSGKGYLEDPVESDEMQAMIDMAEYPELVQFLTVNYKPLGVRGLMNGLVKVASLNRKHEVFGVCCDAIDSLGYNRLASTLRSSLASITVTEKKEYPNYYVVWVKRLHWSYQWSAELRKIDGSRSRVYGLIGSLVPKSKRAELWAAMLKVYPNHIVKTSKGSFKVKNGPKCKVM